MATFVHESMDNEHQMTGKRLDALCAAGRHGGTTMLPVQPRKADDERVLDTLGVTAHIIRSGVSSDLRKRELENPRTLPVIEYNKASQSHFWGWAEEYTDAHRTDAVPRLFGLVSIEDLQHFQDSQTHALAGGDESMRRALDLPIFTEVPQGKGRKINQEFFALMAKGVTQGVILEKMNDVQKTHKQWEQFLETQKNPQLLSRPFIAIKGDTSTLISLMEANGHPEVDTLICTETPSIEAATHLAKLSLAKMQKRKTGRQLDNPFNVENPEHTFRVAVLNVQGSAREDATALLRASQHIGGLNVEVVLVENAKQLEHTKGDAVVFPGGWHKIQYERQRDLGINELLVERIKRGVHVLALCAGSIQTRRGDDDLDEVKSKGCAPNTTFGIGDYRVVNNALSNPRDILCALQPHGDPTKPGARVFPQIPLSNAPYFTGINLDTMQVIARLSTRIEEFRADVDDEEGDIVALMVKRLQSEDPVQIAAAFHDQIIFTMFLHEMQQYQLEAKQKAERLCLIDEQHEREKTL